MKRSMLLAREKGVGMQLLSHPHQQLFHLLSDFPHLDFSLQSLFESFLLLFPTSHSSICIEGKEAIHIADIPNACCFVVVGVVFSSSSILSFYLEACLLGTHSELRRENCSSSKVLGW